MRIEIKHSDMKHYSDIFINGCYHGTSQYISYHEYFLKFNDEKLNLNKNDVVEAFGKTKIKNNKFFISEKEKEIKRIAQKRRYKPVKKKRL